jgi:hypothetical protein
LKYFKTHGHIFQPRWDFQKITTMLECIPFSLEYIPFFGIYSNKAFHLEYIPYTLEYFPMNMKIFYHSWNIFQDLWNVNHTIYPRIPQADPWFDTPVHYRPSPISPEVAYWTCIIDTLQNILKLEMEAYVPVPSARPYVALTISNMPKALVTLIVDYVEYNPEQELLAARNKLIRTYKSLGGPSTAPSISLYTSPLYKPFDYIYTRAETAYNRKLYNSVCNYFIADTRLHLRLG